MAAKARRKTKKAARKPARKPARKKKSTAAKPTARKKAAAKKPRAVATRPSATATPAPTPSGTAIPTAAPKAANGAGAWKPAAGEVGIRVRMYRVGFGDFFLVTLLGEAGEPIHIIIDCGVFKGTKQTGDIGSIEASVADMVQTTGGKVALIIMTHRHADHIAGFARCAADFKKLAVDGVWMSIWESQYSPAAVKFQAELTRTALALQSHFAALGAAASPGENTARQYMQNATGDDDVKGAKGSNTLALNLLKHGFSGVTPQYYQGGDDAKLPPALVKAGLTAQILGPPPVADLDLMKLMDLKKGVGQYLAQNAGMDAHGGAPFGPRWEAQTEIVREGRAEALYGPDSFREWTAVRQPGVPISIQDAKTARSAMQSALELSQPGAALTAAKQLNSFLNNQSLVVLFTFKGKKLLFVGDAQAGNWEHWLFDTDTPDKAAGGALKSTAQQILTSLDFYKVGHHGSGNATPKAAVQAMGLGGKKFATMCSTQADVYGTEDPDDETKGTEVPRTPLVDELASETRFVRSDQIAVTVNNKVIKAKVAGKIPAAAGGSRFVQGAIWIDCFL
jgi:beta-lactamase superfamily II metal-dependent hydrolase